MRSVRTRNFTVDILPKNEHTQRENIKGQKPQIYKCRKVASSNMSRLEAPAGFFRLLMKGIFDPYVL